MSSVTGQLATPLPYRLSLSSSLIRVLVVDRSTSCNRGCSQNQIALDLHTSSVASLAWYDNGVSFTANLPPIDIEEVRRWFVLPSVIGFRRQIKWCKTNQSLIIFESNRSQLCANQWTLTFALWATMAELWGQVTTELVVDRCDFVPADTIISS